jgi:hypothetical protein
MSYKLFCDACEKPMADAAYKVEPGQKERPEGATFMFAWHVCGPDCLLALAERIAGGE